MADRRTILIVEDSPSLAMTCQAHLEPLGHEILIAPDGKTAWSILDSRPIDCVLLDLKLPDMDGIKILEELRKRPGAPAVIVITANASLTTAVHAVRVGAFDYLVKPFAPARLTTTVEIALGSNDLRREVETLRRTVDRAEFVNFIGRSLPMQAIYRIIEAAAPSSASVFITGESGTGKELTAEAVHQLSPRKTKPLVVLNCGAIPRDLLESTIFGHVRGAFTGAMADQEGAAARSDGGTLFLDELGEMDILLQTKLLRFIQTGTYQRVGDPSMRRADIRFIAATNREPEEAIREGRLREDLFYRLNVVPIRVPPLRDRGEDVLLIARRFLKQFAEMDHKSFTAFAPEVEARFLAYTWPGNVRQLQNVVRNIVVLHDGKLVTADMVPSLATETQPRGNTVAVSQVTADAPAAATKTVEAAGFATLSDEASIQPLATAERLYIEKAIEICNGNLQLAARRLGISPSTIYRKKEIWAKAEETMQA